MSFWWIWKWGEKVACWQYSRARFNSKTWVVLTASRIIKFSPSFWPYSLFLFAFAVSRVNVPSQSMPTTEGRGGREGGCIWQPGFLLQKLNGALHFLGEGREPLADEQLPTKWITPSRNIQLLDWICINVTNGKDSRVSICLQILCRHKALADSRSWYWLMMRFEPKIGWGWMTMLIGHWGSTVPIKWR